MNKINRFEEFKRTHLKKLFQYVPIVDRVHGAHHPEFHDVRKIFDGLYEKVKNAHGVIPDLTEEFLSLREITTDYKVPADVCETYEAVYEMLKEIDEVYHS